MLSVLLIPVMCQPGALDGEVQGLVGLGGCPRGPASWRWFHGNSPMHWVRNVPGLAKGHMACLRKGGEGVASVMLNVLLTPATRKPGALDGGAECCFRIVPQGSALGCLVWGQLTQ
jgi:hypothetical protein